MNHKIIFAEHIVCVFSENIISHFDVSINDVVKEFAERLRFGGFLADGFLCKYFPEGHIRINTKSLPFGVAIFLINSQEFAKVCYKYYQVY